MGYVPMKSPRYTLIAGPENFLANATSDLGAKPGADGNAMQEECFRGKIHVSVYVLSITGMIRSPMYISRTCSQARYQAWRFGYNSITLATGRRSMSNLAVSALG